MLAIMASLVNAADKDFYVGVGFGSGSGEYTYSDSTGTTEVYTTDYTITDIKIGSIYKNNNRIEVSYNSVDVTVDGLTDKTLTGLDVDFIWTMDLNNKDGVFLPFLSLGIGSYTWNNTSSLLVSGEDIKGVALNYGIGAYINVASDVDIEIAYKSKTISWQELTLGANTLSLDDSISLFYLGARYNF